MVRKFKHAVTGREMRVADGTRTARLVEADNNWSEVKPKSPSKEADSGSSSEGGRRGGPRKAAQRKRGGQG